MNFIPERISKSAEIILLKDIETVFPLFGAIEEKKWADGWEPEIIYSESGGMEEGMIFRTEARGHLNETYYTWIVSKLDAKRKEVEYIVSTINRVWVIKVNCGSIDDNTTRAVISYTFTGLTPEANEINKIAINKMFENNLKDWEEAINYYLKTGSLLKE